MSGPGLLIIGAIVASVVFLFALVLLAVRGVPERSSHSGVRRVRRTMVIARIVATAVAVAVMVAVVGVYPGVFASSPALIAIVWVLGGIAAEIAVGAALRDGGASLEQRQVKRYLPLLSGGLAALAFSILALAWIIAVAVADTSGESISYTCGLNCNGSTSWPGGESIAPVVLVFAVLLLVVAVHVRLIVRRPRGSLSDVDAAADDATRRASVAATLLGVAAATALTAAGLALQARVGFDPQYPPDTLPAGVDLVAPLAAAAGLLGLIAAIALAATSLVPVARAGRGPELMFVQIDDGDPTPPYEQLRRQLLALMQSGALAAGERVPPIRQLAADLGIAAGTVARSYRELEAAGWLVSRRGGGTRVTTGAPASAHTMPAASYPEIAAAVHQARAAGASPAQIRAAVDRALDTQ